MHIATLLILAGIIVELLGVLLLSVDAIGLQRVHRSIIQLTSFRAFIISRHPTNTFLSPVRFYVATMSTLGGSIVIYFVLNPPSFLPKLPYFLAPILGGTFAVFLAIGTLALLGAIAKFLSYLENSTERRTAGIIGFSILSVGLSLQFVGTLFDAIHKN
jgi:hypothetical protein